MNHAYICDAVRTPVGKYGGRLSSVRTDDLAAIPIRAIINRNPQIDPKKISDVILGCANQAGEDNRNVARMALLLAGLPETVSGVTVNRLCGSGMEAVGSASRAIQCGEADLVIAGGVESMSRSPFVIGKAETAFYRSMNMQDTTIGWRFVNKKMQERYGTESMMETAENIAEEQNISREDQDAFAHWSQEKTAKAQKNGTLSEEIVQVSIPQRKGDPVSVSQDEHPRLSSLEKLATLKPVLKANGTITAANASGVNDGAAALLIASEEAVKKYGLKPVARISGMAAAGVMPRIMGMGPVPATEKLCHRLGFTLNQFDIIELNEAFAAQALSCMRTMGLADDDKRINPRGGAIALGHPLGMSGARLLTTAFHQMRTGDVQTALCTMCIGVGQGISMVIEKPTGRES